MATPIVNNTGTNYTLYYNVINYFRTIMSNHPSIQAATMGDLWDFGERQFPQYPICNIQILESDFGTSVTNFRCQLMIADKVKNKNNESNPTDNTQTYPFAKLAVKLPERDKSPPVFTDTPIELPKPSCNSIKVADAVLFVAK